jgi:hypothetical protein
MKGKGAPRKKRERKKKMIKKIDRARNCREFLTKIILKKV